MIYLRSILFNVLLFTTVPFYAIVALLFFWLPYKKHYLFLVAWQYSMVWLSTKICGIRYQVTGLENLPKQAYIIASNHQSAWETLAFSIIFPNVCFILKKNLLSIPLFGWALRLWQPIAIDRKNPGGMIRQVISQGSKRLSEGRTIIIFPEGHRMPAGKLGQFRSGAAALARATGAPLVPVYHNAGKCWPRRSWIKRPGLITVHIGKPIYPSVSNDIHQEMVEKITSGSDAL